ncbi:MAG TPA: cytochrome C [Xanthobacteraceae bacterium]|nr:cytochrome C [Xanthobacteraceae bacterium]
MKAMRWAVAALLLLCSGAGRAAPLVLQPEPPPGAAACTGCHAVDARTKTAVPRIHGRSADDIVAAMAAFRSGSRVATVMDRVAKGFTDDETRAIAAWFASQK